MLLNEMRRVRGWQGKKDVTGRVVHDDGEFWVDREDIETGEELVRPEDPVQFRLDGRTYIAVVTDEARGRDDDVYRLSYVQG